MPDAALPSLYPAILAACGIVVPPDRLDGVIAEIIELRGHIDRLNAACPDAGEPATLFGNGQ